MQAQTSRIMEEIKRLSSMSVSEHMDQTKFSLVFPVKNKFGRIVERTMALEYNGLIGHGGGIRFRWGSGPVETAQLKVAYCWSTKRNKAGYFIGWREVVRKSKPLEVKRDQLIARKSKKRLEIRQRRLAEELRSKNTA